MKTIYLIAALVGAVVPYLFFLQFLGQSPSPGVSEFVAALFANGAAGGFSADLLISSFVFWIYMFARRTVGPSPWLFMALNLLIGLSCALPAYLYANEQQGTKARESRSTA